MPSKFINIGPIYQAWQSGTNAYWCTLTDSLFLPNNSATSWLEAAMSARFPFQIGSRFSSAVGGNSTSGLTATTTAVTNITHTGYFPNTGLTTSGLQPWTVNAFEKTYTGDVTGGQLPNRWGLLAAYDYRVDPEIGGTSITGNVIEHHPTTNRQTTAQILGYRSTNDAFSGETSVSSTSTYTPVAGYQIRQIDIPTSSGKPTPSVRLRAPAYTESNGENRSAAGIVWDIENGRSTGHVMSLGQGGFTLTNHRTYFTQAMVSDAYDAMVNTTVGRPSILISNLGMNAGDYAAGTWKTNYKAYIDWHLAENPDFEHVLLFVPYATGDGPSGATLNGIEEDVEALAEENGWSTWNWRRIFDDQTPHDFDNNISLDGVSNAGVHPADQDSAELMMDYVFAAMEAAASGGSGPASLVMGVL